MLKLLAFLLFGLIAFLWWLWKNTSITRRFKRAIETENTADIASLLVKYDKQLANPDNMVVPDVFYLLVLHNSMTCMKVLFSHADAATWQRRYIEQDSNFGPLVHTINFGTTEMLRFLLEQGMKPEPEPLSPWLWATSTGLVDAARVLDEFGANTITPEQQREEKTLDEELLDEASWENEPDKFVAVVEYLLERSYPVPEAALRCVEQLKRLNPPSE